MSHANWYSNTFKGGWSTRDEVTSTEILTYTESGFSFSPGPALPRKASGHCLLKVNNSASSQEYVMLGGFPDSMDVHYINLKDPSPVWSDLPYMPDSKRGSYCGYVEEDDGTNRRIVVAAGKKWH